MANMGCLTTTQNWDILFGWMAKKNGGGVQPRFPLIYSVPLAFKLKDRFLG